MSSLHERSGRIRLYLLLVGLAIACGFPLPFAFDDGYDASVTDGLVVAAYFALFTAVVCGLFELTWSHLERRRKRRYGDLAREPFTPPPVAARMVLYVLSLPVITLIGMAIGETTYDCPPDAADCDLGILNIFAGGVFALGLGLLLIVVGEITLAVRRSRR